MVRLLLADVERFVGGFGVAQGACESARLQVGDDAPRHGFGGVGVGDLLAFALSVRLQRDASARLVEVDGVVGHEVEVVGLDLARVDQAQHESVDEGGAHLLHEV